MKSIVRRDTGDDYETYVKQVMAEEGIKEPTSEEVRQFDKQRKDKKVSNEVWGSETDPEARITKMRDGTTHLAYKAEHVVDLETNAILAAEIYAGDQADSQTLEDSVNHAQTNLNEAETGSQIQDIAADKGYHAMEQLTAVAEHTLSHLHSRAGVKTQSPLDRQAGRAEGRGVRQSAAHERKAWQTNATPAK
jgi:transposase